MIIGFDGKRAVSNLTGLGNYSRLIVEAVAREHPSDSLLLFAPRDSDNPRLAPLRALPNVSIHTPAPSEARLGGAFWRSFGLTKSLKGRGVQLFHGLSNELPLNIGKAGIPSVLTMHDVIYRTMPECYSLPDRKIYDLKYGASCRRATRIIAISECTRRDIMRFYGVPEERISVVYQGVDSIFHAAWTPVQIEEIRQKYSLPAQFLLQVGSIERRKNALLSVRALSALPASLPLVLVGRGTPYLQEIRKEAESLGVADRLRVLSSVPFPDLPGLYKAASVALYPSRYEGFGLPVLEAVTCGTPVVAATGSCLEEAGGEGALYVDPDDARALAEAISALLATDPAALRAKGAKWAARFSNDSVAANTYNVYEQALRDFS